MPNQPSPALHEPSMLLPKLTWEDPCLTLERVLEAKAQGGPPNDTVPWQFSGYLGPLGTSGGVCL